MMKRQQQQLNGILTGNPAWTDLLGVGFDSVDDVIRAISDRGGDPSQVDRRQVQALLQQQRQQQAAAAQIPPWMLFAGGLLAAGVIFYSVQQE